MNPVTDRDKLVAELCETYDLSPGQITFNAIGEPVLNFDALQVMTHALCTQIKYDEVSPNNIENANHFISCTARLTLDDGREITRVDIAQMGERIGQEDSIESIPQAINVAAARAYRKALRAIGFNAIRAHYQAKQGNAFYANVEGEDDSKDRRELHALATELGYIKKDGDRSLYRNLLSTIYNGKMSSTQLTDIEARELLAFLRQQAARLRRDAELKAA